MDGMIHTEATAQVGFRYKIYGGTLHTDSEGVVESNEIEVYVGLVDDSTTELLLVETDRTLSETPKVDLEKAIVEGMLDENLENIAEARAQIIYENNRSRKARALMAFIFGGVSSGSGVVAVEYLSRKDYLSGVTLGFVAFAFAVLGLDAALSESGLVSQDIGLHKYKLLSKRQGVLELLAKDSTTFDTAKTDVDTGAVEA